MIIKTLFFLVFFSILSYFCGEGVITQPIAAVIHTPNEQIKYDTVTKHKSLNKKDIISSPVTEAEIIYYSLSFIQMADFTPPINIAANKQGEITSPSPKTKNTNPVLYNSLYEQGKELFIKNKDSEILYDSLIIFSQTRQFLKETDLMLHNLTQDILLSLNLVNSNQSKLFFTQQKDNPENNYQSTTESFSQQIERSRLQDLRKKNETEINPYSEQNLIKLIFNLKNLYYLLAIVFLVFITKQLIKLMFIKDQFDNQNRR